MNTINIAICDDEPAQIEYLDALVRNWAQRAGVFARVPRFGSAESFLFAYEQDPSADILLLDIQMKKLDGVALARKIRAGNDAVQIIFVTGYPDFAALGYEVAALHYLVKPVSEEKLFAALDRAKKNLAAQERSLFLTVDNETRWVPLSQIRYVEAQGHYLVIRTDGGDLRIKANLSDFQKSLGNGFFRCQRSFVVSLARVHRITRTAVILDGGAEIPLSRDLYDAVHKAIISFL